MKESKVPYIFPLVAGPMCLLITLLIDPPFAGMSEAAWRTAGLATCMAIWWITEAVPIPVTSLLPMVAAPLMGIAGIKVATASFAHPLIFLFLGGFILSIGMERWNLHRRIALVTMLAVGSKPSQQIGGIMLVTAFLSMWMSNTATTVMMLPIGLSIIELVKSHNEGSQEGFSKALLLAIAYSASIGGLGTLIGTPPNALLAAYLSDSFNIELGFGQWMMVGVPLASIMLVIAWYWLTHVSYRVNDSHITGTKELFTGRLEKLGKISKAEKMVLVIFVLAAASWIFRPMIAKATGIGVTDTGIAMLAAMSLFILPVDFKSGQRLLEWEDAKKIPWGVLLLFGGGLSLAALIKTSGLATFIGEQIPADGAISMVYIIVLVTALIIFLTEITSNTATAAGFLPLLGPIAISMNASPMMLVIPAALAASCAFMMPVATPPNAIVFASGELRIKDMLRAGLMLNLVGVALISAISILWAQQVLGF